MPRKHPKSQHRSGKPAHRKHRSHNRFDLKWVWITLGILLFVIVGYLLLRPREETASTQITPTEAYQKYQEGAFFLDVRSQEEWVQAHIAGSNLIPLDELPDRLNELPTDQEIVVVCRSGRRSQSGATILQQAGFSQVSCLEGGLQAWANAGYPVEGDNP